jgi:hypothetical protein
MLRNMVTRVAVCLAGAGIVALGAVARADDVPFAQPNPAPLGASAPASPARLGDMMSVIQTRHAKLWFAGSVRNWPLAAYEMDQLKQSFIDAAMLYGNIPVDAITLATRPLDEINASIKARDSAKFSDGFRKLTTGCNSCHAAGGVGFIAIRTPTASPFSNQTFEPAGK